MAAGVSSYVGRGWAVRAIENGPFVAVIKAEKIALHTEDPTVSRVGALSYVAGWALTSESDDFGGWSGMALGAQAKSLTAINDKGDWLEAKIDIIAQNPLSEGLLYPFEEGARGKDKTDYDAESLVRTDTGFLVGFEQNHRILEVDTIGGANRSAIYNQFTDLSALSSNGGLEAMTRLSDGRLLMFAEHGLDQQSTLTAWIADDKGAAVRRFLPPENYSPTDAATLPNGDVLLLMRHYSTLDGVSAKVLHIPAATINGKGVIQGTELAHLAPPYAVDNMEALDVQALPDGTVRLYMMSDDNFSMRQQTLLLVFDWKP